VAIGNGGKDRYRYPGAFKEVLAVGAVDFERRIAPFSGNGDPPDEGVPNPDLTGYGVGVYSGVERDFEGRSIYQRFNGTSMATPYVAGVVALYRCQYPTRTIPDIRQELSRNALPVELAGGDPETRGGKGLACFRAPRQATTFLPASKPPLARIGEPSAFPVLALTCTPAVAKLIESLPEVEAVVRDSGDLEMIRG
jgi:subtilisin family serine protease